MKTIIQFINERLKLCSNDNLKTLLTERLKLCSNNDLKTLLTERLKLDKDSKVNNVNIDPNDPTYWKVGDIVCGTWSYSMTIPYFYRIEKRTAKSFTLVELKQKLVSGHYNGQYEVVPKEPHEIDGKPITARIKKDGYVYADRVHLYKWTGKPLHGDSMD